MLGLREPIDIFVEKKKKIQNLTKKKFFDFFSAGKVGKLWATLHSFYATQMYEK